ncbi:calcium channel protein CCH1 NDAI_0D02410 [Naumovozyma dairenensis CBS 421]|uniref:Calcium-channel protein CCH1 n=1 Tax=Naumovozyma dairenensis (strain ATCC 10597 / BCRC 20456 / CBS 421 / NBRC 0211 / NRRL Y-12639) TaxID=1071378 RepID=G0W9U4_NAUDC|nr:hypothetical protein NDAI_0D02410 [Naumovozyma dairenensis CBS 421]CCD24555.1 hypothetical protein NDAI_0D02410 [Naumovozyma dairenensis CBS 421]
MDGRRSRAFTEPSEAQDIFRDPDDQTNHNGQDAPKPIIIPQLNIIPPHNQSDETLEGSSTQLESKMAKIFRTHIGYNKDTRKHPKLSLRTNSDSQISIQSDGISPNIHSAFPTLQNIGTKDERLRSPLPSERSNRRPSASSSNPDAPPRSAKVLSLIAPEDMDEFEDLEKEFRNAIDEKGLTWLPQVSPKKPATVDTTSQNGHDELRVSGKWSYNNEQTPEEGPSRTPNSAGVYGDGSIFVDDIGSKELDTSFKENDIAVSTISLPLPDFEQPLNKPILKTLKLYGNSIAMIPPTNPIRIRLARFHTDRRYKTAYFLLLLFFTILLSYRTYNPRNVDFFYILTNWSDYVILTLFAYFTVNDITKILAFGFWDDSQMFDAQGRNYRTIVNRIGFWKSYKHLRKKYGSNIIDFFIPPKLLNLEEKAKSKKHHLKSSLTKEEFEQEEKLFYSPRAFARSSWNRIDLVSSFSFWLGIFLSIRGYDKRVGIRVFKPLSVLRILRLVNTDTGLSSILRGVKHGIRQLINVGFMLVYFWAFFGILGVQTFKGSFRRQCVWINPENPTDTYQYSNQFCGGYLEPVTKARMPYVFADGSPGPISKGFLCPQYSQCISNSNPYNGRISFDNIVNSMEMVFIIMSANTFTDLMYYTMDSDEMAACLFFLFSIFVLTIWMMNLLIAVLVSSFELANEKFKRKKLVAPSYESMPVRFIKGYWKYFQVKAAQTKFPNWASRSLRYYRKIEWTMVVLILTDLIMRSCIDATTTADSLLYFAKVDRAISIVLFLESMFRLLCHFPNIWKFLTNTSYVYDFVISIVTLITSCLAADKRLGRVYYWLSIFQISRFYRVILSFPFVKKLWKQVLKNGIMIWNLSSFYFSLTFLSSIIMALYFEGVIPLDAMQDNLLGMTSLPNSFLSLFVIGSTENWTDILYALQQYSPNISSAFFCSVLLIIWFILSNSVVLNIFIALISQSLEIDEDQKRPLQIKHYLKYVYPQKIQEYTHATLITRIRKKFFSRTSPQETSDFKQFLIRGTAIMNIAQNMDELAKELKESQEDAPLNTVFFWCRKLIAYIPFKKIRLYSDNPFYKKPEVVFTEVNDTNGKTYVLELNEFEDEKLAYLRMHPAFNYSYFIFPPRHRFRKFCQRLVPPSTGKRTDGIRFYEDETDLYSKRRYFHHLERDVFVFLYAIVTVLLVVCSCYVTPIYRRDHHMNVWSWDTSLDCAFIFVFLFEFMVKTVADGWLYSPNAYIRNPWNLIDFLVLVSLIINLVSYLHNEGNVSRIFKGLTALRALRCLTISTTARQTFTLVMFDGIKKIGEAGLISFSLLFPFTVWGLNLFRGRLGKCNDSSMGLNSCFNEYTEEVFQWDIMMPRVYQQPHLYFDSFGSAFRSLYEIISLEGWVDLLEDIMNSTGVGSIPSAFSSASSAAFLVLFNFLSMVFILNLFVSFIITNHAKTTGQAYYTIEEKSWLESLKLLTQVKPKAIPNLLEISNFRKFCYRIAVEKTNFYYAMFLQIVLYVHILMLLTKRYTKSTTKTSADTIYFMISTTIFLIQELLRLCGEGLHLYIKQKWNIIRLIILMDSFVLTIIGFSVPYIWVWFHNMKEVFHLIFFLFLIPQNDMLSELIETAMASLPPILSLTYTWAILFLVYAIALNQIFGLTRLGPNTTDNLNFRTVIKSLIALFRCSFGEGWNYIMDDLTVLEPYCYVNDVGNSDCGSLTYAYILLMSWNVLSMYIFMNMFITLIIGNFSYVYRGGGAKSEINRSEIRKFVEAWAKYDSDGTGELDFSYLPRLMHSFDGPLSFTIWEGRLTIKNLVANYMEVNPNDPYDVKVDLEGLNKELSTLDKGKVLQRRLQYRRFVQEVYYTNAYRGALKFSNLLQQIPLYTAYNPRECLGIDHYVRYLYTMGKVDKYLDNRRNVDVLDMVVTRWKYRFRKNHGANNENHLLTRVTPVDQISEVNFPDSSEEVNQNVLPPLTTPRMDFGVNNFMWSPRNAEHSHNPFENLSTSEEHEADDI